MNKRYKRNKPTACLICDTALVYEKGVDNIGYKDWVYAVSILVCPECGHVENIVTEH